ncbi:MAG TPA: TonB family protein [Terriglobales bacterium]|nr:TonB family protein [Terriglobales bacterium]
MAFRALLFSKSSETSAAMAAACKSTGIRAEVYSDIFTAIEKGKTQTFSCVILDWADQPEASFLLKRAHESVPNRDTVTVAIVDNEPTHAEMRDNRLNFLIYRPISADEANAVLAKACEQMQPLSAEDAAELPAQAGASSEGANAVSVAGNAEPDPEDSTAGFPEADDAEDYGDREIARAEYVEESRRGHAIGLRGACAAVLIVAAVFLLWRSRATVEYLSRTPEGRFRVLKESVAALFYANQKGALPVGSATGDTQQDAYFSRDTSSNAQTPALAVVATESTLPDAHIALPKAPDFPLPVPVFERQEAAPIHVHRAAIPESMRNSAPIERPVVVTVNPAQMMPVSAPQPQPAIQPFSEPVALSEEAARALLIHTVNPVYPTEASAQKLHGPVVLQVVIGRDGSVEDLKIVRGYFILGRAAIAAVKQWRFQPYTLSGHAAATQTVITVNFSHPPG